jgi:hypothetical protein
LLAILKGADISQWVGVESFWERQMGSKLTGLLAGWGVVVLVIASAGGQTTTLYSASTDSSPTSRGLLTYQYNVLDPAPVVASTTGASGETTFNTTANDDEEGGWSNYSYNPLVPSSSIVNSSFPSLNPTTGFSVSWTLAIGSESSMSSDTRSGFDVIVLGSDEKGVELAYEDNDVWAQEYVSGMGFEENPAQDSDTQNNDTFSTGPSLINYNLSILGGNYTLTANGTTILTGATQNYTAYGLLPYTLPNFVFMGDDTTEADSSASFSSLAVSVPEPVMGMGIVAVGVMGLMRRRRAV